MEFCIYGLKTCLILLTAWGVAFHRRCNGFRRYFLIVGIGVFWLVAADLIANGGLLGYWLIFSALYRGVNTATAQYVWHGLSDPESPRHPKSSTVLWLPAEHLAASAAEPGEGVEVPVLGTDWAFFDNYHLIHHLHPRAHFTEYPRLLKQRLPSLLDEGTVVMRLAGYDSFVADCWTQQFEHIAASLVTPMPAENRAKFIRGRLAALPSHRSYIAGLSCGRFGDIVNVALVRSLTVLTGSTQGKPEGVVDCL